MKVISLIKRAAGTVVDLGGKTYTFAPADKTLKPGTPEFLAASHVCDVTDRKHLGKLLAIAEGYALDDSEDPLPTEAPTAAPTQAPASEAKQESLIDSDQEQDANRAKLAGEYETLTGKKPSSRWNATRIAAEIDDLKAAADAEAEKAEKAAAAKGE